MENRSNHNNQRRRGLFSQYEPKVPLNMMNWRRLFAYLSPYRWRMTLAIFALLLSSAFGLAFPMVIVKMLGSVTQAHNFSSLNLLAGMLIGIFLFQAAFNFIQSYLLAYIGEHIVYDLRTSLFAHLQKLSLDFYANRRVGDIVSRLSSDVTQMRTMLTNNITMFLSQIITLVGSVVIVVSMNASLTLFILALVPLIIVIAALFGRRVEEKLDPVHPGVGASDHCDRSLVWAQGRKSQRPGPGSPRRIHHGR